MTDAVVTLAAKKKMMLARAGEISLPKVAGMAFGTGGVKRTGEVILVEETQNSLNNEVLRKAIDEYTVVSDTKCKYTCVLKTGEIDGIFISEIGLYDEEGDFIAIKSFPKKEKVSELEMTIHMYDEF